jgi:hypothetical protein
VTGELDLNAIAADVSTQLAKDFIKSTFGAASEKIKLTYETTFTDFTAHLAEAHRKIANVKIITSKDTPVDFKSIFVASDYSSNDVNVDDNYVLAEIIKGKRCVISGNGGAGKTFAMRNFWMRIFEGKYAKAPILVELRKLNTLSSYDIINFIRANAFGAKAPSERAFEHFCEQGSFILLLDGFDEVVREKREELERQILRLADTYKNCGLVVSGRPDDRFDSWSQFHTFKTQPLDYDQFRSLISKVPFDGDIKKAFLDVAKSDFFKKHNTFLSNPLLSLMMLLTFRDNAEIPSRLSTFYENCFSTLYSQHDALKESFNRKKSLDQLQFKRAFSAFSLATYLKGKFAFDGAEFIEFIEKAKAMAGLSISNDDLMHDFLESVNLLVKDGLQYTFIHRSFQEFFAAFCLTNVVSAKHEEILRAFARRYYDGALRLAYEIQPQMVEEKLIFPKYNLLKKAGLPRRLNSKKPFFAVAKAGVQFHAHASVLTSPKNLDCTVALEGLSGEFNSDYEEFSAAINVVHPAAQRQIGGLFNFVVGVALREVWEPLLNGHKRMSSKKREQLPMARISISFSEEECIIDVASDDIGEEVAIVRERMTPPCLTLGHKLERLLLEKNSRLVSTTENLLLARRLSDSAIGEALF